FHRAERYSSPSFSLLWVRLIKKPLFVFPFEATRESGRRLGVNNEKVAGEGSDDALRGYRQRQQRESWSQICNLGFLILFSD
ncbi:hypothetical protein VIGAN_07170400, partial [Vigna angularis var. angularis]